MRKTREEVVEDLVPDSQVKTAVKKVGQLGQRLRDELKIGDFAKPNEVEYWAKNFEKLHELATSNGHEGVKDDLERAAQELLNMASQFEDMMTTFEVVLDQSANEMGETYPQ